MAGEFVEFGCDVIEGAATVVKVLCLGFCGFGVTTASVPEPMADSSDVVVLGGGPGWNVRPVLATHPATGDALVFWLREQEPIPGSQQSLASYYSRLGPDGWSVPQRVDPASNFFDLQPSVRFDRQGRPAAVWVRDLDGDLDTPADRALVFSRLDGVWSPPETLVPLPPAPWTPSLDFDVNLQPVVAFVVPATHPRTGELLGGDGTLSTLHVARRVGAEWQSRPAGESTRAERPVLRVHPDNHALVFYRGFGSARRFSSAGEVAAAVANLAEPEPRWSSGGLTAGGRINWQAACLRHNLFAVFH